MQQESIEFYYAKIRLSIMIFFNLLIVVGFGIMTVAFYQIGEPFGLIILGPLMIILTIFLLISSKKLTTRHPYIQLTKEALIIQPFTKSETIIDYKDIAYLRIQHVQFQKLIAIHLHNEDEYYNQLSRRNKFALYLNRKTDFTLFTLALNLIKKQERQILLDVLTHAISDRAETPTKEQSYIEQGHMNNQEPNLSPKINKEINLRYFGNAYLYSLLISLFFIVMMAITYFDEDFFAYIVVAFIGYPFAKVVYDVCGGFKLQHAIDKQEGPTMYIDRLAMLIHVVLYFSSVFLAPIGLLITIIKKITAIRRRANK